MPANRGAGAGAPTRAEELLLACGHLTVGGDWVSERHSLFWLEFKGPGFGSLLLLLTNN